LYPKKYSNPKAQLFGAGAGSAEARVSLSFPKSANVLAVAILAKSQEAQDGGEERDTKKSEGASSLLRQGGPPKKAARHF
jgi:hypothetical protein